MIPTWGSSSGRQGLLNSADLILPFLDSGSGAVDTGVARGTGTLSFTRATAAAAKLSTGLWKLDVASGTARSHYIGDNTAVGAYGGFLSELAATNECLWSRDLTQASWVNLVGSPTTAKTSTGIDGVANSCTRVTSTGAGNSIGQTITGAASSRTCSVFVKRVTGTGSVALLSYNGAESVDITSLINSTTFTRVSFTESVLDQIIAIRVNTSGDAIDVDCFQFESGAAASTPIPTTTVAVTRNADQLKYTGTLDFGAAGAYYCECTSIVASNASGAASNFLSINDATANERVILIQPNGSTNSQLLVTDGGVAQASPTINSKFVQNTTVKFAGSWTTNLVDFAADGTLATQDTSATMPTTTQVSVGNSSVGAQQAQGCIKNLYIWLATKTSGVLTFLTT